MGSPLDGRIRIIARGEAEAVLSASASEVGAGDIRQQVIDDLHGHLHHAVTLIKQLEARVDVLEGEQGNRAVSRRTSRKEGGDQRPE